MQSTLWLGVLRVIKRDGLKSSRLMAAGNHSVCRKIAEFSHIRHLKVLEDT